MRLRTDLKYPEDEDIYAETLKDYVSLEYGNNKYELDPKNSSWIDIKASDLVVKYNPFPDQGQGNSGTQNYSRYCYHHYDHYHQYHDYDTFWWISAILYWSQM